MLIKGETIIEKQQYVCPKCGNNHYESDQFQATGGNFAKVFDVQNKKFVTISCTRCGYTELYKRANSEGWDIFDFLMG
ncbi:zinc ribbon domain-containing protein [[Clostridium] scindens]|uniref:zinc ribbon domain-containing protein n=1 Tax=Clostridium scindens (strain JCM 10418 / VPI 12708) TaxID=29347 RepID=UPI002FE6E392